MKKNLIAVAVSIVTFIVFFLSMHAFIESYFAKKDYAEADTGMVRIISESEDTFDVAIDDHRYSLSYPTVDKEQFTTGRQITLTYNLKAERFWYSHEELEVHND